MEDRGRSLVGELAVGGSFWEARSVGFSFIKDAIGLHECNRETVQRRAWRAERSAVRGCEPSRRK